MVMIAASRERHQAEREAFLAAGGVCADCRDEGPCSHCARGQQVLARMEREAQAARERQLLDGLRLSRRQQRFTLETYAAVTGHDAAALAAVRSFIDGWDTERGLLLVGGFGTGKTGLMVGALRVVAQRMAWLGDGSSLRLWSTVDLFRELRAGYDDGTYERTLRQAQRCSVLALDDLGAEKPTAWVEEQVYALINHRYEAGLPVFATSNLGMEALAARVGERSIWRLYETSAVIEVTGRNLREAS
jgi:DNA replication protein DnaC